MLALGHVPAAGAAAGPALGQGHGLSAQAAAGPAEPATVATAQAQPGQVEDPRQDPPPDGHAVDSVLDGAGEAPAERHERAVTAPEAGATVDAAVLERLAAEDEVAVLVELAAQADLDEVAAEAARAGQERAREARRRAAQRGAHGREIAAAARQAAHERRVETVVDALQSVAAATRGPVAQLLAEEEAAGRARDVREFWITNGFAAVVDAAALERLAAHPDVAAVLLDEELEVPDVESHPRLPTWSPEAVGAPQVWGEYGFTGDGVVVGVLDTGVDGGHPALAGRYRGRDGDHDRAWYVPTGENYPQPGDGHGHGTHVAGSIVGGPPGEVVGVAPDADWIGVKIFRDSGTTSASIIRDGMQWVLAPGGDPANAPHIVNNSWGAANPANVEYWDEVEAWVAAGIFPVFANGNSGPGAGTVGSPASFPHAFAVGATDRNDLIAPFSSRGPAFWDGEPHRKPELSAPGHEVRSAWPRHTGSDYHTISGTSMAAPHVAGVAALVLDARPDLTIDDLRAVLVDTARGGGHMGELPNDTYGHGIADAFAATTQARFSGLVAGTVTGPDGPVEATVRLPDLDVATTSDPDTGEYELVVREGEWTAVADAYGYLPAEQAVDVRAQETTTADFTLAEAPVHALTGTVLAGGEPVADARVELAGTPLEPVTTGAAGRFAFEVAEGSYELRVRAHGYAPVAADITVEDTRDVTVTLSPLEETAAEEWPEYQNNPARTGFSDEEAAPESFARAWSVDLGAPVQFSSPVAADGSVYVTTDDGRLHALDAADGTTRWTFTAGTTLRSTPAVAGGRVYLAGGDDGTLYALDAADGTTAWTFDTGDRLTYSTPTEVDGTVYLTGGFGPGDGGRLYALDAADGALAWSVDVGPQIFFGPTVADGTVFAASRETGRLVAVDADSGDLRWERTLEHGPLSMPAYADGVLYLGTTADAGGTLYALDAATGESLWEAGDHGDSQGASPVVYGDLVIVGSHQPAAVAAYDRDSGARVWRHFAGLAVSSAQLVTAGGVVLGGSQDRLVWALDATTGERLWDDELSSNVLAAPALADGTAVFADNRGLVAAYTNTGTLAGTVTGPDGPLDATVELVGAGVSTTADPDTGAFELTHRPGTYEAEVRAYGFGQERADVTLRAGRTTTLDVDLAAVGDGSLRGTVTDADGSPLEGARVEVTDSPLDAAVTDADGGYAFDAVAAGGYEVVADADGYAPATQTVTVVVGEERNLDFALERYDLAVVADHEGAVSAVLADHGWLVERVSFAGIVDTVDAYGAIVVNGSNVDRADADLERFAALVEAADAAGVSAVFLDQWSVSYGSIRALRDATGDPERFTTGTREGPVSLVARGDHPLTQSLPAGERVQILSAGSDFAWFGGYSGQVLADLHTEQGGIRGAGVGYQRRTLESAHLLLPAHAATPWAGPGRTWLPAAEQVLVDAVAHALAAEYGAVAGTVTDAAGEPVAARVTVTETGERVTAGADGTYELILDPGGHTLRFAHVGSVTTEEIVTVVAGETATLDVQLAASGLGTIAGTVSDATSGEAIAGATVAISDPDREATTAEDGGYTLEDVPGGTYDLAVTADGYLPATVEGVEVTEGEVTTVDVALELAPRVAVLGDRFSELTDFLRANDIPAAEFGWDVVDHLDELDVVVLNHPLDPGRDAFLAALEAFDGAGVSVIVGADGWTTRTRGGFLFSNHLGDPAGYGRVGGFNRPAIEYHNLADHPVFASVDDPVEILTGGSESAVIEGYSGLPLADVAEQGSEPAGVGMAYAPRTADSVHLFVGGLAATFRNSPASDWTPDGQQLYLDALRLAAAPRLGVIEGTVVDPDEAPIAEATVEVAETGFDAVTGADGTFAIPHPAGAVTLEVSAFGHVDETVTVDVPAGEAVEVTVVLEVADVGRVAGVVTSRGDVGPTDTGGLPLEGASVRLLGTPRTAETDADGRYLLDRVEPGTYDLEVTADGHVRTIIEDVEVAAAADTTADVALRPSPQVGVIDDFNDHAKGFLEHWGYDATDLTWDDTDRVADLDLVIANLASFPNLDPGPAGWRAFADAVDRAGVPVIWLDQFGRGAIQWLRDYEDDPAVRDQGRNQEAVTARVAEADHPLFAGLPETFELTESGREHAWFDDYSGTVAATLETGSAGEVGATVAYRGRTSANLDILLSTLSISFYGHLPYGDEPGHRYTPEAERLFRNALAWALDAPPLAAEARGVVRDAAGERIASEVTVAETGKTFAGRAGDGTFVVPLQPGEWTLEVAAFGYLPETITVDVAAGDVVRVDVTLATGPSGDLEGRVTDAAGDPIAGAAIDVLDAPLATETGSGGRWSIAPVPAGEWTVEARAPGYMAARSDVTVVDGETHTVDFALEDSQVIAIAGDQLTHIEDLLAPAGYEVDQYAYNVLDEIAANIADYPLVILNGRGLRPNAATFTAFLDAAAEAETSVLLTGQFGSGSVRDARDYVGDPETVSWSFTASPIYYEVREPHPIFDGLDITEPIELMADRLGGNQQYLLFGGYSGTTIADLDAPARGDRGDGVAYRFTSPRSVHVLLASLQAAIDAHGNPATNWTDEAKTIYLNAVAWAIDAAQAEIHGVVTSGGEPLEGARVTAVEAGVSARTDADGAYSLGVPDGEHTVRVELLGYEPVEETVVVGENQRVRFDVALVALARGTLAVTVVDDADEAPVADATVTISGPVDAETTTTADGEAVFDELLEGAYEVEVTATGYLPASTDAEVAGDARTDVEVRLTPNDVAVIGDVDGAFVDFLREEGVAAEERAWDVAGDVERYEVVVVNDAEADAEAFAALLDAADAAGTSLVFTGTWGVGHGGIRALERHTDDVTVGGHGYRDGPVALAGFDPDHPLFAGLDDPSRILADDSYYSWLESYVGPYLAGLEVGGEPAGVAVAYDFRGADHLHLLVSVGAVSPLIGPGYGWTEETGTLLRNALAWARTAEQAPPETPTLTTDAELVATPSITVTGEAPFRSTVAILRDGEVAATGEPDRDGAYRADVPLAEGENTLVAVASNFAGSAESEPLVVWLDTQGPELDWVTPADGEGFFDADITVAGTVFDEPAGVDRVVVNGAQAALEEDGAFALDVTLEQGVNTLEVVAVDTLGNETVETRTVAHIPLEAEWELPPRTTPRPATNVQLHIRDADGTPTEVDAAVLEAHAADGTVHGPYELRWADERYHHVLRGLPAGAYALVARLDVDGWAVTLQGPTVEAR